MKIIFLVDSLQVGGAEKSILEISKRLKEITPIICVLYPDRDDLRDSFNKSRIQVVDLNLKRGDKLWFWKGKKAFKKICKELQPGIVHAHLYKSEIIARFSDINDSILIGSFVSDTYSNERYESQSIVRNIKLNITKFFDKISIRKNRYITSITNAIAVTNCKELNYPLSKVVTIYRGRSINEFERGERKSCNSNDLKFIAVGRTIKSKGYFEIIEAIKICKGRGKNINLSIVGCGNDYHEIEKYIVEQGVSDLVKMLGFRMDINELLNKSDCFIFASHFEGQGGALVEAMLTGIPIITSNIDVFKEQVENDFSAKLFNVKDSNDLADKICWILDNYEKAIEMGKNARMIAERRFDIELIAKQTEYFYKNVISE